MSHKKALVAGLLLASGLGTLSYLAIKAKPNSDSDSNNGDYQISLDNLTPLLQTKFPNAQLILLDKQYYYTSWDEWTKIFADVLLNMPERTVDRFDCENFAFLTTARVNERYRLNTCGFAIGMGWAHSFNVFIADDGIHTLDAETGEVDILKIVDFLIMG